MADTIDRGKYTDIPQQIWSYYDRLLSRKGFEQHRLVQAIQKQGEETTWRGINELFALTSRAAEMSPGQLFEALGLGKNDFDSSNFQAMMGILRAINILGQHGFSQPKPLRPLSNRKEADFLAKREGKLYAVEVFRSSELSFRYADPENPGSDFAQYLRKRLDEKLPQVNTTIKEHDCDAGLVVVAMDSQPSKALNDAAEYQKAVRAAIEQVGNPSGVHLFIFTGMADERGNNEYACYPPLS